MASNLYVGNLDYSVNDDELGQYFSQVGDVVSAKVIVNRNTNRSKGFGFVEMANEKEAKKAVDEFNGKEFKGRKMVVNEARPRREDYPPGR